MANNLLGVMYFRLEVNKRIYSTIGYKSQINKGKKLSNYKYLVWAIEPQILARLCMGETNRCDQISLHQLIPNLIRIFGYIETS